MYEMFEFPDDSDNSDEFPYEMRPSTLEEREEFYRKEFDVEKAEKWLWRRGSFRDIRNNTVFAVIIGRHSDIYSPKFEPIRSKVVIIDEYESWNDIVDYILYYLPEGVYYDRNVYTSLEECRKCEKCYKECWDCSCYLGQELAFDIDPENVPCPVHGMLEDKMERQGLKGSSFCMIEFDEVRKATVNLYKELEKEFSDIAITFSGRGFHIYIFDEEAVKLNYEERKALAERFQKYYIDEWVTSGGMRLIRLPYSLNGVTSRIVIPLKVEEVAEFDPRYDKKCMPGFLEEL